MAFFNLEGTLVSLQDGTPIKRGSIKLEEAVSIAASTVKDRLAALNFERVESGSATLFAHTRLPGEESTKGKDLPEYLQYATLLLPHAPAAEGLWANNLVSTGQLDFCTVLPHVEQHLMVSSSPLFILSPKLTIFNNTPAVEALEEYQKQILDAWRSISTRTKGLNVLAYGAGGASLILALAADQSLRDRVHKLAFLECDDAIAKALSLTSKQAEERGGTMWSTSPVVTVLDRRAIAFKQDKEPVGSVIKQGKESHCACPIVSIGPVEKDAITLEGGALGLVYFRKKIPQSLPRYLVMGIVCMAFIMFILVLVLTR